MFQDTTSTGWLLPRADSTIHPWLTFWFECSTSDRLPRSLPSPTDIFLHNEHSCYNCDQHQSHRGQDNWNRIWPGILDKLKHKQEISGLHILGLNSRRPLIPLIFLNDLVFRHCMMILFNPQDEPSQRYQNITAGRGSPELQLPWSCQNGANSVASMSKLHWKPWKPRSKGNWLPHCNRL